MTDLDTLLFWIQHSGLSNRQFARRVLGRSEASLRRWLQGTAMPADLVAWIHRVKDVHVAGSQVTIIMED